MSRSSRRDAVKEETRKDILKAARKVFARDGYGDASLAAIVQAARVTTGAIYHHFRDKKGLFYAVAEEVEAELMQRILGEVSNIADPWEQLSASARAMLRLSLSRDVRTILLQDAPTVLGLKEWRALEHQYALGALVAILSGLQAQGHLKGQSAALTATILIGAFNEAASAVAFSDDPASQMDVAQATIQKLLNALRA